VLDKYIAGQLTDNELYKGTQWEKLWSWPYELSLPIFQYCRDNKVRLVALNTDSEVLLKVSQGGLEALTDQDWQRWVPDRKGFATMTKDAGFKTYMGRVIIPSFYIHEKLGILNYTLSGEKLDQPLNLNRFVSGRLIWDETMAGAAVQFVEEKKGQGGLMCVLVGGDHVKYQYGLRARMERLAMRPGNKFGRELQVASVMLNPGPGDALSRDGPMMAPGPDGQQKVIQFSDFVFAREDAESEAPAIVRVGVPDS
ncbi:unnamed protein product, partial [Polarella glacialis]